ncbi:MAG TPA: PAS domain S-box protein [Nitrospirota bacterium]|nr:PAS domain S-box protein [Nitrospirota bacterium]
MTTPLHILLVEDSEDDALLLVRELRRGGYEPVYERIENADAMRAALAHGGWDIVISDYILPGFSGLAALELVNASGLDLPFIIVSGNIGEDIAVNAMRAGAHDYIIKGNLKRLNPAVERELRDAEIRRQQKFAEEALRETRQRLFETLETIREGFYVVDREWRFLYVNAEALGLWKKDRAELIGKTLWEIVPAVQGTIFEKQYRKAMQERTPVRFEAVSPLLGIWLEARAYPTGDGLAVYFQDISDRKKSEERASRLNRLYSVLGKANEAIMRSRDPDDLYRQVCRITVEEGLFKMAWIGLIEPETLRIVPVASFGDDGGYLNGITVMAADVPEGRGPTGRAVTRGIPIICGDIEHDEIMQPWREKALQHGLRSSAAFPLRSENASVGAFTIYATQPQYFSDEEFHLLSSLAADISFAIESLRSDFKRKEAEGALRIANAYNRSLLEASLDPLVTIGADGKITDVNAATEEATGRRREELLGTDFSEYFTDPARARAGYLQVFREGSVRDYALELRSRSGGTMHVLYNASLYRDDDGKVLGIFAAARDITRLKESELRTMVTNNLLELFTKSYTRKEYLDAAVEILRSWCRCRSVGMRFTDRDGNIPYVSCKGYEAVFIESENIISLQDDECACTRVVLGTLDPLDTSATTPNGSLYYHDAMAFRDGLTEEEKKRFRGVCQKTGYRSLAVIPIRHRDKVLGAIHLADEREGLFPLASVEFLERQAYIIGEAMFRFGVEEEQRRLVSAVESSADAVVITDTKGIIRYVNRAFETITGYAKDEVLHASLHILDSGHHPEDFFRALREELSRTAVWRGLMVNRKKDGSLYHEESTFSPVKDADGQIINFVAVKRDVTERLRLESIAESVNTMNNIGYVFAGVRHEIGNPINSAKMSLSVLHHKLDTASKETIRDYVDRALGEIGRVEHLLKNLKNYNLYEKPELELVDLAGFFDKFFKLVSSDFEGKGIAVNHAILPGTGRVVADPRALQQVLLNVMTNASDALAGRPRPAITVTARKEAGRVLIRIADNGAGMNEKQVQDLFKPFYTSKAGGTGLGLVIVRKMLARMNGTIDITSTLNEGTTVHIYLPEGTDGSTR